MTIDRPLRIAYADPPYIGQAKRHYKNHKDYGGEVDHGELLRRLVDEYPDGWALSLSTPTLGEVLDHVRSAGVTDYRVGAWVKPFCAFKVNVNPAYAWEPVIWRGGRKRTRQQETVRDWVSEVITLKKGVSGAKPFRFCVWLFELMNMEPRDELIDLFPGSGAVSLAWKQWTEQSKLNLVYEA